ncbi:MAG: hypothetical protein U1F20_04870 [Lysobacterales bacterium]
MLDTPPPPAATPAYVEAPAIVPDPVMAPPPAPEPRPTPPAPAPDPASARAQPDGERLPPPPLFECTTYDNDHYLSDDGTPSERCAPLEVTGIGDGSAPGVGAACQKQIDTCQRVPDGAACDAWKRREREARASLMFGKAEDKDKNQAEYERVRLMRHREHLRRVSFRFCEATEVTDRLTHIPSRLPSLPRKHSRLSLLTAEWLFNLPETAPPKFLCRSRTRSAP